MITHTLDQISSCPKCRIRTEEIFNELATSRVREELVSHLQCRTIHEGETLFREGDAPQGVVFLDTGRVKLTRTIPSGRRELVKVVRSGEIMGLGVTLTMSPHRVTAEALETCSARLIAPADFRLLLRQNAFFLGTVVDYLEGHAHRELTSEGVSPAVPALAAYLIAFAEKEGQDCSEGVRVELPLTVRELSLVLRVPFEQLNVAFNNLEDRQWLYRRRSAITITEVTALQRVAGPLLAPRTGAA